jgi:hypothetical protein
MTRYLAILTGLGLGVLVADVSAQPGAWGTIKGRVVFGGSAIPARPPLEVNKDQQHCLEKGMILSEELVVHPDNKGVRWVMVWLKPTPSGPALAIHPKLKNIQQQEVVMDQPCCMFIPHVLTMRQGQVLVVKNSSPVLHNANWTGADTVKNPGGNQAIQAKGQLQIPTLKPDRLPIKIACNIHPWMSAHVGVFDHPYHAVTDADGRFTIPLAPAGEFQLVVWQEKTGWVLPGGREGMKVTVKDGGDTDAGEIALHGK